MTMSTLPSARPSSTSAISFLSRKRLSISIAHREGRKAPLEGLEVLEGEHGGGREHRDLLAVAQRFERGAHGDLGLAVAHVAAQQPVHGMRRSPCLS